MSKRFYSIKWNGELHSLHNDFDKTPVDWKKPKRIFAFSMTDFFHENIDDAVRDKYLKVIEEAHWHTFFILTKRASEMYTYFKTRRAYIEVPHNLWLGVSIESKEYISRAYILEQINCRNLFISFEPLLGSIPKTLLPFDKFNDAFSWVIVGCESGPGHRPMQLDWVREIRDVCIEAKIPFYFKQAYEGKKMVHLPKLDGKVWDQMPS